MDLLQYFSSEELEDYYVHKEHELMNCLSTVKNCLDDPNAVIDVQRCLLRCFHSLKGHFSYARDEKLVSFFHNVESCLVAWKEQTTGANDLQDIIISCLEASIALLNDLILHQEARSTRLCACCSLSETIRQQLSL